MSQSGFEMFSNVAGMVIVIADVIFFYALWNIFCKNKKENTLIRTTPKRNSVPTEVTTVRSVNSWLSVFRFFSFPIFCL